MWVKKIRIALESNKIQLYISYDREILRRARVWEMHETYARFNVLLKYRPKFVYISYVI